MRKSFKTGDKVIVRTHLIPKDERDYAVLMSYKGVHEVTDFKLDYVSNDVFYLLDGEYWFAPEWLEKKDNPHIFNVGDEVVVLEHMVSGTYTAPKTPIDYNKVYIILDCDFSHSYDSVVYRIDDGVWLLPEQLKHVNHEDVVKSQEVQKEPKMGDTFLGVLADGVADDNSEKHKDDPVNNGGKTDYYQTPDWIKDADDFAEWRGLNFFQGNILKSVWCFNTERHKGTTYERELNKVIHYAQRELERIKKEKK